MIYVADLFHLLKYGIPSAFHVSVVSIPHLQGWRFGYTLKNNI